MRIVAWQIYDADFATTFIIVELITTIMILASILFKKKENTIDSSETADDLIFAVCFKYYIPKKKIMMRSV